MFLFARAQKKAMVIKQKLFGLAKKEESNGSQSMIPITYYFWAYKHNQNNNVLLLLLLCHNLVHPL
jgi:hypothetical protein